MLKAKSAKVPTMETLADYRKKKRRILSYGYFLLAFFVPFTLMAVAFAMENIAPFGILKTGVNYILYQLSDLLGVDVYVEQVNSWGTEQMHVVDMWHQYFPFLVDLHEKLQSGGSLFWTWSVGMGVNFIAMMSYYLLSPLNFLSVLFPTDILPSYIAFATAVKIALAGLFMAICFKIVFKKTGLAMVFFSTMFSFCAFNMGYYWNIMWLDSVAMLPLVVAGTISLLRDGKYKLFIISLSLAVIFNYYIGLFICVAVFITAVGYTASCWYSFRKAAKDLLRTLVSAGIALMITALVTIPAYLALQNCYQSSNKLPTGLDINIGADSTVGIIDAVHKTLSNTLSFIMPAKVEGLPNISCSLLCLALLGIFFCSKKIKKGEKIFCVSALGFFVISFIFRRLDFMWHGFHYPNQIPYRFSFLFSFLLIFMAYRAYLVLKDSSYIDVIISALIFSMFILLYYLRSFLVVEDESKNNSPFSKNILIASIIIGAFILIAVLMYTFKFIPKRFLTVFLCLVVVGEMSVTAVIGVNAVGSSSTLEYPKNKQDMDAVLSYIDSIKEQENPDIYRVEETTAYTLNDGTIYQYPGISMFNSMANATFNRFFGDMGGAGYLAGNRYTYYDSSPVTNVLFNLRYLIGNTTQTKNMPFMQYIYSSGNVTLYENTDYISMGFLANSTLENFELPKENNKNYQLDSSADPTKAYVNPIENQIQFWRKATGIKEPLYTPIEVSSTEHDVNPGVSYSDGMEIGYTTSGTKNLKYNFTADKDGYVYTFFYISGADGKGKILLNNQNVNDINVEQAFIAPVGQVKTNDIISLEGTLETSSWIRAHCYYLNEDVYEEGIRILSESKLKATEATDTTLKGTINANRDGVLYTSIPYEKGWTVKVDGVEQDVIPLGVIYPDPKDPENMDKAREGGTCCVALTKGEHTIEFSYTPAGFKIGLVIFIFAILILTYFILCNTKKLRTKKFAKPVLWLFDPTVKEKAPAENYFAPAEEVIEEKDEFLNSLLDKLDNEEISEEEYFSERQSNDNEI